MSAATMLTALPLFPLQAVLFPGGLLNLKVFEARYLDLVGHCLRESVPFGVVCLRQGAEVRTQPEDDAETRFELFGTLAEIETVDAEQLNILRVRCIGTLRFRIAKPHLQSNGLWQADAQTLPDEAHTLPSQTLLPTVRALAIALTRLAQQGHSTSREPYRIDDAGWVANRWCELLPISLAAKQKLLELDDPQVRLQLVDEFLRGQGIVS